MNTPNATKLALGALLVGASALSGNALLATTAAGIGVNWASEALGGVVAAGAPALQPGTPLARAYTQSMRRAVNQLRQAYQSEHGRQRDIKAFALLSDAAGAVAQAEFAPLATVGAAQQELASSLDALLHGHDEQQVAFLKARLLEQVARAFQEELAADDEAWRLFHGWLIQATAQQSAALRQSVGQLPQVLDQLRNSQAALDALHNSSDRLEAQLDDLRHELWHILEVRLSEMRVELRRIMETLSPPQSSATNQSGGINFDSGNTITNSGDVFAGDKVLGDKVMGNKNVNYGVPRPADISPDHIQRLLDLHTRRLRVLEQQAAMAGNQTPPHIVTEIEDIHAEIMRLAALSEG